MKKQKPEIVGSVRVGGVVYKAGMEEELSKAAIEHNLTQKDLKRLVEKGVIVGIDLPNEDDEPKGTEGEQAGLKSKGTKDPKESKEPKGTEGE